MAPHRKIRSSPAPARPLPRPVRGGLSLAVLVLLPLIAVKGGDTLRTGLDFTAGVLSLVSLTASVAWGLLATDRLLLTPRHRLLAQGVHRVTAVASLGFLLLHITVKVSLGHVALLGALFPFGLGVRGTAGLIGFGSLGGLLMMTAAATGALRGAFASPGSGIAGRWRSLHMLAYPAWCAALVHGLYAGRPPKTWVIVMYCLSLVAVGAALSPRLLPYPLKRRIAARITTLAASAGGRKDSAVVSAAGEPPLTRRVPMTEELPVLSEARVRPGCRPTPSPPPPGQATPAAYGSPPAGDPWHSPGGERL
ncbi:hypothetical protein GCM10020367_22160 [Streptomyces sannanensis]|uniref:Cytochrome b/b6 domain-containing protein n=1 Tax=Streptomyces sannanensis TaxID=285536 RepID=A0ABP6S9M4_9ACTN